MPHTYGQVCIHSEKFYFPVDFSETEKKTCRLYFCMIGKKNVLITVGIKIIRCQS